MSASGALTRAIAFWASGVGASAAQLPSSAARGAFLAAWHRELAASARRVGMAEECAAALADTCIKEAEKIVRELLARDAPSPGGRV